MVPGTWETPSKLEMLLSCHVPDRASQNPCCGPGPWGVCSGEMKRKLATHREPTAVQGRDLIGSRLNPPGAGLGSAWFSGGAVPEENVINKVNRAGRAWHPLGCVEQGHQDLVQVLGLQPLAVTKSRGT